MSMIRISCPHCSFSREVAADKLPDQPVQATCPKCKQVFEFDKASAPVVPSVSAPVMTPPPLPGGAAAPPSPPPPPLPGNNHTTGGGRSKGRVSRELLTVAELFEATWELYKQRWLVLLGIFIATAVACVVPPMLVSFGMGGMAKNSFGGLAVLIMSFGVALCLSLLIACWGMAAALSAAVDERLGFNDSFNHAKNCWISLAWVSTLYSFIAGGASLLFLIPGILTAIWFFACPYLVVAEETRGMEALLKSKALVDGRFWPVTGRLVLVWLLGMLPGTIPVIGVIFSLLLAPFSMLYTVILYRNLSETVGTVSYSSSDGTKAGWLLLGLAGYILVPLLIFFLVGASFFTNMLPFFKMAMDQKQGRQMMPITPPVMPNGLTPSEAPTQALPPGTNLAPPVEGGARSADKFEETDLSVFIYAVNCPGTVRVNGQEFKVIKSEPNMQYNINTFGTHFRPGSNNIEFDLTPATGSGRNLPPRAHIKISHKNKLIGEWHLSDQEGWPRSVTLEIADTKVL